LPWIEIDPTINADTPTTRVKLVILAPKTFPRERLGTPLREEVIPTNNSGREVAIESNIAERIYVFVPVALLIPLIESKTKSADLISKNVKIKNITKYINIILIS